MRFSQRPNRNDYDYGECATLSTTNTRKDPSSAANNAMTRAMARNVAEWHDVSVRALGIQTYWTDSLWWRKPGGSGIYVGAIILGEETDELFSELRSVQEAWGTNEFVVYDAWETHELDRLGAVVQWKDSWYLRSSAPLAASVLPEGLSIERVTAVEELVAFERATVEGFSGSEEALQEHERFSQHAPLTLEDPSMTYLVARLEGQVIASTIAHVTGDMLGIYGVSTLLQHRRRGYARALIHASVALRPDLPASVQPVPPSVPIYTDIGFSPAGDIAVWKMG